MNAMNQPTNGRLSLFVGLLSSAIAACSGVGQDGLVTVGVRPSDVAAASGGTDAGGTGGLPMPGSDVMNRILDGNPTAPRDVATAGASGASAGIVASAGSGMAGGTAGAGAGGAGTGAAGAIASNTNECGAIPATPAGKVTSGRVSGSGLISYEIKSPNVYTRLRTTLTVPAEPSPSGQIFIWPGIQPTATASNLQSIGNGALLSVLTWGPSCARDAPSGYSTWWIAPTYSNISSSDPQFAGCHAGPVVLAEPTQVLEIEIHSDGTKWIQRVVNRDTLEAAEFSMDLKGQAQGRAFFDIELPTSNKPTEDIVFTNTVLTMDMSDPNACQPVMRGSNDFASKPRVSTDGKHCCIDRIVLRARGVMATTTDPP